MIEYVIICWFICLLVFLASQVYRLCKWLENKIINTEKQIEIELNESYKDKFINIKTKMEGMIRE